MKKLASDVHAFDILVIREDGRAWREVVRSVSRVMGSTRKLVDYDVRVETCSLEASDEDDYDAFLTTRRFLDSTEVEVFVLPPIE